VSGAGDGLLIAGQPRLLEDQNVVGAGERREDGGVGDVVHGAGEARLEPTKHGEDELAALDGMADGAEFCSLQLDALTVLRDGGVTLGERVELLEEEDGARLLVGREELLYGLPELTSSLIVAGHGEVEDGVADGAEEPTLDTRVGDDPVRIIRDGGAGSVDVRTEAEFAAQNLEVGHPLEVVGGHLQHESDVRLHAHSSRRVDEDPWRHVVRSRRGAGGTRRGRAGHSKR